MMRVGFVERWLDQAVCRWPLAVATYLGKCWQMSRDVSPSQVEKYPASMAAVQVLGTGMKHARCSYVDMYRFLVSL